MHRTTFQFPHIDVRAGEVVLFPKPLAAQIASILRNPLPPLIVCLLPTDKEHESNVRRFELSLSQKKKGSLK